MCHNLFTSCLLLCCVSLNASESPIADAVECKDRATAIKLLKQKSDANAPQVDGTTALHWAAYHDDAEIGVLLLEAGAKADAENRYGVTPLYSACQNGNVKLVKALLKHGADPDSLLQGEEALLTASRTGSVEVVKALIKSGARINAKDHHHQTALMWAAAEGNLEVVELLIEAGANIRHQLDSGFTPLLFAVREGREPVVHALLKAGLDVNEAATPKKGRLPKGSTPLTLAIENGHFALATSLLKTGANANDTRTGFSPLHMLSWVRKPNGGDGPDDLPPPDGSGTMSSLQFAKTLIEHGAKVNARLEGGKQHWKGATPFYLAAWTADLPLMRTLVKLGADPLINASDGSTPLMAATGIGRKMENASAGTETEILASAKYFLELGVDINAVNSSGETAMHGAAYKNLPKVVAYLDQQKADVKIWHQRNKRGSTPYLIAAGYRPGNFKPSYETMSALKQALARHGIEPTEKPPERIDPYAQKKNWDKAKKQ
ncbi:MAG: ankyrin repeat domain-containing protein [Planctomycetota bacterium]|nr:ankyrin repeat domain-containing protein [Planctomycetota bacterium]